jgi:hypothetical protein
MAQVKSRSIASGALALAGLMAAGVAFIWQDVGRQSGSIEDAPVAALPAPEPELDPSLFTPPDQDRELLQRRGMLEEDEAVGAAESAPDIAEVASAAPTIAKREMRREMVQAQKQAPASETGPIEFIVKLDDKRLTNELRDLYHAAPDKAARRLKQALGDGRLMESAELQGFTLGGEAILRWNGPPRIVDYGARQAEIQRVLSAAPGVSYAEQNYIADVKSGN